MRFINQKASILANTEFGEWIGTPPTVHVIRAYGGCALLDHPTIKI